MLAAPALSAVCVAVLHCDATPVYGRYTRQMFRELVAPSDAELELCDFNWNCDAQETPDWNKFQAVIITGSNASAYSQEDWVLRLTTQIKELVVRAEAGQIRLLGVCFGHQLLAQALGGEVKQLEGLYFGRRRFLVSAHAQQGLAWDQPALSVLCSHSDVVTRLPPGAQPFGISPRCGVEGMIVGTNVMSVQGHPEFSTASGLDSVRALAKHFVSKGKATEEMAASAIASAEAGLADAAPLRDALVAFLRSGLKRGPLFGASGVQPILGFGSLLSEG